MSEFQYFEFKALERDLTGDRHGFSQRLAELRNLRSRKRSLIARLDKAGLET